MTSTSPFPSPSVLVEGALPRVQVDQATEALWSAWLSQFADANFYQTWAYGAVSWGERQLSHLNLQQEGQPLALAQLRVVHLPLVKAGVAYLRWGPCCRRRGGNWNVMTFRRTVSALVGEYVEQRGLLLRVIPPVFAEESHAPEVLDALQGCGLKREASVAPYRTLRVDLRPEPELIRRRLDGKWRNMLNAAERHGLTVIEGTGDKLYATFLDLYDEMLARKRFDSTVDPRQFRRIQARLADSEKMLIMLSAKDGVPQTGLVATAVGETGIYLLGATSNDGLKSKGSYLLQWCMMNRLRERGCCWYDLGGINPESNPGVYKFKQGMGGQEYRQLGRFSASGNRLIPAVVAVAERFRSLFRRFKRKR